MSDSDTVNPYTNTLDAYLEGKLDKDAAAEEIDQDIRTDPDSSLESLVGSLMFDIVAKATTESSGQSTNQQKLLVTLLLALSQRPTLKDKDEEPERIQGALLWEDMPLLGWEINAIWNARSIPANEPARSAAINEFVKGARFTAALIATKAPPFQPFRLQILWSFRSLETSPMSEPDVDVPGLEAIMDELSPSDFKSWEDEWKSGKGIGAPARGGPLWQGKQGFCVERYELWKRRLGELAGEDGVSKEIGELGKRLAERM